MSIVYRHRKLSDGTVFYIGIGKSNKRAYSKRRTNFWHNIVNKHDYEVEILKSGLSRAEACELECLLISEYGRLDLGTGCLVNMTDGGDNFKGRVLSEETKYKISKAMKGREFSKEHRINLIKNHARPNLGRKLSKEHIAKITKASSGRRHSEKSKSKMYTPVLQYNLNGDFIKNWLSIKEVSLNTKISSGNITEVCQGKRKTAGGFIWKYKNK